MNKYKLHTKRGFNKTKMFNKTNKKFINKMYKELKQEEKLEQKLEQEQTKIEEKRFPNKEDEKKLSTIKVAKSMNQSRTQSLRKMINEEEEKIKKIDKEESLRDMIDKLEDCDFSDDSDSDDE